MHVQQNKPNLRAWWNNIKGRKHPDFEAPFKAHDNADHPVFGKSLNESLKYASVQISTANTNGDLYVWGYIPVVVAKCGLYLKEMATEVPGTFRVSGSNRRMRELQAAFESPPRFGKNLDWRKENYTTHDVASVFRRYLTQMPEPVIPHDMYNLFRDTLAKRPFNQEEAIANYKSLIRKLPKPNQYLLLYVLDLLSVFARKSELNLMTATNLAVIFRPGLISHPSHEQTPQEYELSQRVLEFLIAQQDWFMLDISPPSAEELIDNSRNVQFNLGTNAGPNGGRPLVLSAEPFQNGRWPDSTNIPSSSWTANSNSVPATWNNAPDVDVGPSTPRTRNWIPSRSSSSQPNLAESRTVGQLTEQITPISSAPPSPTIRHFDRTRSTPVVPQVNDNQIDITRAQQRRPSSPLNSSYLPNFVNRNYVGVPPRSPTPSGSDVDELMIIPSGASLMSTEEDPSSSFVPGGGGWKIIPKSGGSNLTPVEGWQTGHNGGHLGGFMTLGVLKKDKKDKDREREEKERVKMMRRRTTIDRTGLTIHGAISSIQESPLASDLSPGPRLSIQRSRTLPSRRRDKLHSTEELDAVTDKENDKSRSIWNRKDKDKEREKRVLKKNRPNRLSMGITTGGNVLTSSITTAPLLVPGVYANGVVGQLEQDASRGTGS